MDDMMFKNKGIIHIVDMEKYTEKVTTAIDTIVDIIKTENIPNEKKKALENIIELLEF